VEYVDSVLDLIGRTPLVRLGSLAADVPALVLAKVEYFNPGGSVKDRIALIMIDEAERVGLLGPGSTIVEPTSGNTGIGLAIVAQRRGYRCTFVCPDKVSPEKLEVLRAYGAEVLVCPTAVAPEHPDSYYSVADRLTREIPGAWKANQYANPQNPMAHYRTTGPEIWSQTGGRLTHFVAGIGSGGTISGVGRYLKEVARDGVRVIGADPVGSVYSGGAGRPYLVEGVGEDFWPSTYDGSVVDEIVAVNDADSFDVTRRLAREEGLLVGGSSGMAVAAALTVARQCGPEDVVVVLLPDGGRGYLSKVFNDNWLAARGLAPSVDGRDRIGDVLAAKDVLAPQLLCAMPRQSLTEAIELMRRHGVSQLPVVTHEPPANAAEVVGAISEREILDVLMRGAAGPGDPVAAHMSGPLPMVGFSEPLDRALERMSDSGAAVVFAEGWLYGVITRQDVLGHLVRARRSTPAAATVSA
jgi:cystathionine beta-synthase